MDSNPQVSVAQPYRSPLVGPPAQPQNFCPPVGMQFRPVAPVQQHIQYMPAQTQHFQSIGQGTHIANVVPPEQPLQYSQQMNPRPDQPLPGPPSSQGIPMPYMQQCRPASFASVHPQQNGHLLSNHLPSFSGVGPPISSSYSFATTYGQQQGNTNSPFQYCPTSHTQTPPAPTGVQSWGSAVTQTMPSVTPLVQSVQASVVSSSIVSQNTSQQFSDWQEHISDDGKKYYHNKKTKKSSWEKPVELMTLTERADALTDWKEFSSPVGRKYYYNKITKQSKWTIPEEVKLAREKMGKVGAQTTPETVVTSPVKASVTSTELPSSLAKPSTTAAMVIVEGSIPDLVTPIVNDSSTRPDEASGSPSVSTVTLTGVPSTSAVGTSSLCPAINPSGPFESASDTPLSVPVEATTSITNFSDVQDRSSAQDVVKTVDSSCKEVNKAMPIISPIKSTPLPDKVIDEDQSSYANKQEAKDAFKSLLQSTNIQSDWTWEQAMRVIINDKRYGALKTLGERKQAFNQYLSQKKKQETEERRNKQKKAREEFVIMLEESKELKSSTRLSKAILMFEGDERFNNVEHHRDREDLFEAYIANLEKMERAKTVELHKRNVAEFKTFLRSCDFIKANSQWRKVQDRLEKDESCFRLDKFDRLKIFQEYLKDLEKEEEEQRKIQKEQVKREERKNRDDFRKLMQEHVSDGIITAKTHWRDYCMKVKDLPIYVGVASNTSGATPKDLFEDVTEELHKQYKEDRTELKDAMKMGKFILTSKSPFEDVKATISMDDNLQCISNVNLKLVYDELLERVKEKEAKQAKKRQRLAENFSNLLSTIKEISSLSKWEECKPFFEDSEEYKSISEECFGREVFDGYVLHLHENAKERERKRDDEKLKKEKEREERDRRKDKERKEKEKERDKEKGRERHRKDDIAHEGDCVADANVIREERKREKDKEKDRKHRRHHHKTTDDFSSDRDEKEASNKKSRRHSSGRRRSRSRKQHGFTTDSDTDSKQKKQKKEPNDGSHKSISYGDLEDGEVGEDGEIRQI